MPGLDRALLWISVTGIISVFISVFLLIWLPHTIEKPIKELTNGIMEIANHNYDKRLNMQDKAEFREVADNFNRMAERLKKYRENTLTDILSGKKFIEAIVNSIHVRPFRNYWLNLLCGVIFPLGLFFYFRIWAFRLRLSKDLDRIIKTNEDVINLIETNLKNSIENGKS